MMAKMAASDWMNGEKRYKRIENWWSVMDGGFEPADCRLERESDNEAAAGAFGGDFRFSIEKDPLV
jgi:hypothetical protein